MQFSTWLTTLLATLPGQVTKEVDITALAKDVLLAELGGTGHAAAINAVIADAAVIFPDPVFRALAVRLLGLVLMVVPAPAA